MSYFAVKRGQSTEIFTSLSGAAGHTDIPYATLLYQFNRRGRDYYARGDWEISRVEKINKIDRGGFRDSFNQSF